MYVNEIFKELDQDNFPSIFFENSNGYPDMILIDKIKVYS